MNNGTVYYNPDCMCNLFFADLGGCIVAQVGQQFSRCVCHARKKQKLKVRFKKLFMFSIFRWSLTK